MKVFNRKIVREIWIYKFRSLLIIGTVVVTLAMLVGMRASYPMIMATYEENLIGQNVADGRFTLISPIDENNITAMKSDTDFTTSNNIAEIEGRIIISSEITYNEKKYPAIVIGVNFPNYVNELSILETTAENVDSNLLIQTNETCLIETRFAGKLLGQDVHLDDELILDLLIINHTVSVQGIVQDTDYTYVVDPTSGMTLMGQMAVIWVDINLLQTALFGGAPLINQILFTVDSRLDKEQTLDAADAISLKLAANGIEVNNLQFELYDETIDRQFFDSDVGSMDKMGTIFGIIGVIICCVVIFNTLNRIVQAQNKNIGLFLSMGANRTIIIWHYVKITMVLSLIGMAIGVPLGYYCAIGMMKLFLKMFAFQLYVFPIVISEFVITTAAVLAICFVFSIISASPITKITPREAMSAVFSRIKVSGKTFSEKIFGWIPIFHPLHMRIALREIFLRKKRTFFTILSLTTSMIILINSVAMVANGYTQILNNYDEYNTEDLKIVLETPVPANAVRNFVAGLEDEGVEYAEVYIDVYSKISVDDEFLTWAQLQCYQENSTLRTFNVIAGDVKEKTMLDQYNILLGRSIAGKYDLSVNDEISIGLLGNYSVQISGLVGELIDYAALWTLEAFYSGNVSAYFGIPTGFVNGILLEVADETDLNALRGKFDAQFAVSQWMDSNSAKQSVMTFMETFLTMIFVFVGVGVFIGIMFSFSSMYLAFIDRENDFIALKAMGIKPKYFRGMIFWENACVSIFSLILTVPMGYLTFQASMDYMIGDRFYIPLTIPLYTWPLVFGLSLISIWLATRRLLKRINKFVLADELRQRMIT